jgi:hypothetical protein
MSSSPPTHQSILDSDEAHRQASPHSGFDRSNPPATGDETSHLFGGRGPIEDQNPTVPHTV